MPCHFFEITIIFNNYMVGFLVVKAIRHAHGTTRYGTSEVYAVFTVLILGLVDQFILEKKGLLEKFQNETVRC